METWDLIQTWVSEKENSITFLPNSGETSVDLLGALQITTKSTLGTLLSETAGVLVQEGWLRLLGGEHHDLCPAIWEWNLIPGYPPPVSHQPDALIVGYDMLGGFFALNGGGFQGDLGNVFYYTPESLEWENLDMGHTAFVQWCITGRVADFYAHQRWKDWPDLTAKAKANEAISMWPPLWTKEGKDVERVSKKIVPLSELWGLSHDIGRQL